MRVSPAFTWRLLELASGGGGGLSGNEGRLAMPSAKKGAVGRGNPSLGEQLGPTSAVLRASAIFSLNAHWSWVGRLNVRDNSINPSSLNLLES